MESSTGGGVQGGAQVVPYRGLLRHCDERRERVSCEAGAGVVGVSGGRVRRARPKEHLLVGGEKVR
jgi:hypothetical protein